MKTCARCNQAKPTTEFYAHPRTADGLLGKCKECHRADVTANRNAKLDRYRAYDRERGVRMKPGYLRQHWQAHPGRSSANSAIARALRSGVIVKPPACWYCGSLRHVVGHHADYQLPLGVTWLCQACHKAVHRMTNEILSNNL